MNNYLRYGSVLLLSVSLFSIRYFFPASENQSGKESIPIPTFNNQANGPAPAVDPFDFPYSVGTEYTSMPLHLLQSAEKLEDLINPEFFQNIHSIEAVRLQSIIDGKFAGDSIMGASTYLTEAQKAYFANAQYGQNFCFFIDFHESVKGYAKPIADRFTPHYSIIPAKEAYYKPGQDKLIAYIREQNKEFTKNYTEKDLNPARIQFVISTEGKIENIEILEPSGIPSIDLNLVKILQELPGEWQSAFNAKGEKVAQPLLLRFGPQGC